MKGVRSIWANLGWPSRIWLALAVIWLAWFAVTTGISLT